MGEMETANSEATNQPTNETSKQPVRHSSGLQRCYLRDRCISERRRRRRRWRRWRQQQEPRFHGSETSSILAQIMLSQLSIYLSFSPSRPVRVPVGSLRTSTGIRGIFRSGYVEAVRLTLSLQPTAVAVAAAGAAPMLLLLFADC